MFNTNLVPPLLAEHHNISYDLAFDPEILVNADSYIWYILTRQPTATVPGVAEMTLFSSSTRQLSMKTITESFTFSSDMNQNKDLVLGTRSLSQALVFAEQQWFPLFAVYIPTLPLNLVDESGFLLTPEHWDQINLGYFFQPDPHTKLNSRPSARTDDILPGTSNIDQLGSVVEDYVQSA